MSELLKRQAATQATEGRFRGRPFDWKAKQTCLHMLHFHLRAMGFKPPRLPPVRGALAARKALDAAGWANIAETVDSLGFERIPAARMLIGDIAYRSSECGLGGILICVGPHKMMGWFGNPEAEGRMVVMDMEFDQLEACWRLWR